MKRVVVIGVFGLSIVIVFVVFVVSSIVSVNMLRFISSKSRSSGYVSGIVTILTVAAYSSVSINTDTTTCSIDSDTGSSYESGQVITNWSATHSSHPYRVYEPKV